MPAKKTPHFTPKLFRFMKDLAANNDRDWFNANKPRFQSDVRDPLLQFISDFAPKIRRVTDQIVADPRPNGGSMFRIYRDTRFSKDKSPYKIHAAAQFRHASGKDVHAPGYYLHLQPGSVFMGAGVWHPDGKFLANIREAIVADPTAWKRITRGKTLTGTFTREGETLKRAPRGFDPEHPLVDDLKRKDHILVANFTQKAVCEPGFIDEFAGLCKKASPFMKFLATANELPW